MTRSGRARSSMTVAPRRAPHAAAYARVTATAPRMIAPVPPPRAAWGGQGVARSRAAWPAREQDELLHDCFWDTLGWEDPCASQEEREEFAKCGFKCDAPDHEKKGPSFCVLPAWHSEVTQPAGGFHGYSYVSGHKFACSHIAPDGKMHHVFVLDSSGSMRGDPWTHLMAAYSAYLRNRINGNARRDLVSVVTFNDRANIIHEARPITRMVSARIPFTGFGTSYASGLRAASEVLSRGDLTRYKPVMVFFSDGRPVDPLRGIEMARHVCREFSKYGLMVFVVGFGRVHLENLQHMAQTLGGSYRHALDGSELQATFQTISTSIGTRAGLAIAPTDARAPSDQR